MENYTITVNHEQFEFLADATEFVSRFLSGQLDVFALPGGLMYSDRVGERREEIEQALDNLKALLFPELHGRGHSHGIGADQSEMIARERVVLYEIYRTMREHQTQLRIAKGDNIGHSVYAHPGLNYSGLTKPRIESH
jgi:hypothetical protein